VVFVDTAPAALHTVRENLARLGAPADAARFAGADAVAWLTRRLTLPGPLVVLADPPYASSVAQALVGVLAAAPAGARVPAAVLEHAGDVALSLPPGLGWTADVRRYGRTGLTILWQEAP
jgi:16S rRNA G966 N2-methylase RsmD